MVNSYLHRLYDTIISRGYIEDKQLAFENQSNRRGTIRGHFRNYEAD